MAIEGRVAEENLDRVLEVGLEGLDLGFGVALAENRDIEDARFRDVTQAKSRLDGNVVFTDLRDVRSIPVGNRFLIYTLYPQANISLRVHWGPSREHVAAAVGHSIFNRTSRTNVGELMSKYGGGGHRGAGTCLLPAENAAASIADLIAAMRADG